MVLYYARRFEDSIAELQAAAQADPQFELLHFGLARVYDAMQRPREALGELEQVRERNDSAKQAELARVHARLGDVKQARAILLPLEEARRKATSAVAPESLAHVYVALKESDRALALLEERLRRAVAGPVLAESGSSLRRSAYGCEIHQPAHPTAAQSLIVRTPGSTIRR